MNTNGSKPSQEPKRNSNEPNQHGKEPISKPYEPSPTPISPSATPSSTPGTYKIEPASVHSEPRRDDRDYNKKSTTEHLKSATEQAGEKIKTTFKNIKDSKQVDDLYNYAVTNKEKTMTYILLGLGLIILLFINDIVGGLIIGLLAGYYYSREIVYFIRNLPRLFESQDQLRYIVLVALLLSLLIEAPGIIIGAAVVAAFKQIIYKESEPSDEDFRIRSDENIYRQSNQNDQNNQKNQNK